MTILSKDEIEKLSTPPSFIVSSMVNSTNDTGCDVFIVPHSESSYSWDLEENIKKEIIKFQVQQERIKYPVGIYKYEPVNEEDLQNFNLLIYTLQKEFNKDCEIGYGIVDDGYIPLIDKKFVLFKHINNDFYIDPLWFKKNEGGHVFHDGKIVLVKPLDRLICETVETFNIPKEIKVQYEILKEYKLTGLNIYVDFPKPSETGKIKIIITNTTSYPVMVYSGMGIVKLIFLK